MATKSLKTESSSIGTEAVFIEMNLRNKKLQLCSSYIPKSLLEHHLTEILGTTGILL